MGGKLIFVSNVRTHIISATSAAEIHDLHVHLTGSECISIEAGIRQVIFLSSARANSATRDDLTDRPFRQDKSHFSLARHRTMIPPSAHAKQKQNAQKCSADKIARPAKKQTSSEASESSE